MSQGLYAYGLLAVERTVAVGRTSPLESLLAQPYVPFFMQKHFRSVLPSHGLCSAAIVITIKHSILLPGLTCRLKCTSLFICMMSTHASWFPFSLLVNLAVVPSWHFLCKTSLLSRPSSSSLTANTYNTTPDRQLPYKTNITAKVPSCQFTLYNMYWSISHKSTVLCPSSCHLLTRLLQLPPNRTPSRYHPECCNSKCCKCKGLKTFMSKQKRSGERKQEC